jgi:hypothetical protein
LYVALSVAGTVGLLALGYSYFAITAEVDLSSFTKPNELDAKEAGRKLKLYQDALAISRRGFIRLSEIEINSYLHQHYFAEDKSKATNAPEASPHLLAGRVELSNGGLVWYCWVRKNWFGRPFDLFWERVFELNQAQDRWSFQPRAMRLGRLEMPSGAWTLVQRQLGAVDHIFTNQVEWLARLPTLEIKTNEASIKPEFRLFTYPVAGMIGPKKP